VGQDDVSRDQILRETLAALDLPPEGLRHWLERSKRFCERHGGESRYGEWMALYDQALGTLSDEAPDAR
jgi:hypothetical protein